MPQLNRPTGTAGRAIPGLLGAAQCGPSPGSRPRACGKFIFVGERKLYVRGVTYGTFRPSEDGTDYPDALALERDFAQMAANGLNAIRTFSVPPLRLLDAAQRRGLFVMVGLPWEQHITFLDDRSRFRSIEQRVRAGVTACHGHPSVLCYAIGNEIPAPIVRWYGRRRIEQHLRRLYDAAKSADPEALVTYVNYPSTEYLELPFVDVVCFNVYLESQERLATYLARLQNLAAERPLVLTETGLDSGKNGEIAQAIALDWQIRTAFSSGCAGAFVFSWTDEWRSGGRDVEDWAFGLTTRDRRPKPALSAARDAFRESPFPPPSACPLVSVVVCSRNGARTIRECLDGLARLEYPSFEVIVVDDGSTDATATIASEYPFTLIRTENRGLSNARNLGMAAAKGEIIAYIDDDAIPDAHWLHYIYLAFTQGDYAAVGGHNLPPPSDGFTAKCVANVPGGPNHVLISDREAEHIPGCNMALRKDRLEEIGGFDPRFRVAGDDVDICWRLRQHGWSIGFSPAAVVWHRRRNSVWKFLRQQAGYGRAEALLEIKWPLKFNASSPIWEGHIYGKGAVQPLQERIYHGTWGSSLFQSLYGSGPAGFGALLQMPEWYLIAGALLATAAVGALWPPLRLFGFVAVLATLVPVSQALSAAAQATFAGVRIAPILGFRLRCFIALLYLLQPLARLCGRLQDQLVSFSWKSFSRIRLPRTRTSNISTTRRRSSETILALVERQANSIVPAIRGGAYDRWDIEARGGMLGASRLLMAVEEHGAGLQRLCFRIWPRWTPWSLCPLSAATSLAIAAAVDGAWAASAVLAVVTLTVALRSLAEQSVATNAILDALRRLADGD